MSEEMLNDLMQDQVVEQAPDIQEQPQPAVESKKELQFKQLRERAERAEQRAYDLERAQQQKQAAPATVVEEDDIGVDDDLYVEGKQYKQHIKAIKRELKQTKEQMEYINNQAVDLRLRSKYQDFDKVVTEENLQKLNEKRSAQFRALAATPDRGDRLETAYEMIKSWVVEPDYSEADNRIAANRSKPRTATTATAAESSSPLSKFADSDRIVMNDTERQLVLERLANIKRR